MHFLNPEDIPPEILAAIQQHQDMHEMSAEDSIHERQQFFNGLSKEQLIFMRKMLSVIADTPGSAYLQGYMSALLLAKFQHCGCHKSHESPEDLGEVAVEPKGDDDNESSSHEPIYPSLMERVEQADMEKSWDHTCADMLEKYNLSVKRAPIGAQYLTCKGCNTPVVSLKDRMLREPGVKGCPTCQERAKWG
jgi:hypothetical protein